MYHKPKSFISQFGLMTGGDKAMLVLICYGKLNSDHCLEFSQIVMQCYHRTAIDMMLMSDKVSILL